MKEIIARNRTIIKDREQFFIASEDVYGILLLDTEYAYNAYVIRCQASSRRKGQQHARVNFIVDKFMMMKKKRFTDKLKESFSS